MKNSGKTWKKSLLLALLWGPRMPNEIYDMSENELRGLYQQIWQPSAPYGMWMRLVMFLPVGMLIVFFSPMFYPIDAMFGDAVKDNFHFYFYSSYSIISGALALILIHYSRRRVKEIIDQRRKTEYADIDNRSLCTDGAEVNTGKFDPKVRLENVVYAFVILLMVLFYVFWPRQMVRDVEDKLDLKQLATELGMRIADMNLDAGQQALIQIKTNDLTIPENLPENGHGKVSAFSIRPTSIRPETSPARREFLEKFVEFYNARVADRLPQN